MKYFRWILAGVVTVIVVTFFGIAIWYQLALQPAVKGSTKTISYELSPGRGVDGLAKDLKTKGIIRSSAAFKWYVTLHGLRRGLQAGSYDLSPGEKTAVIAAKISHGSVAVNQLIVPEGKTVMQIRKLAAAKGISDDDFASALKDKYSNPFLTDKPPTVDLEGYLFPDSYTITKPAKAHTLIQAMLDNFGRKVAQPELIAALRLRGLSLHQGLTLASIVEKEVANPADRSLVAGVFLNRLKSGQPLQSDVTVQYAADINGLPFDLKSDSSYNSYKHPGLPPGPICNPGLASLQAVAHPTPSDYIYFLAGKDGKTYFAKTFAEHQVNIDKHLNK